MPKSADPIEILNDLAREIQGMRGDIQAMTHSLRDLTGRVEAVEQSLAPVAEISEPLRQLTGI